MRILMANDGIGDPGGVQSYLEVVSAELQRRGHALAFLHVDERRTGAPSPIEGVPHFCVTQLGAEGAAAAALAWSPDVTFSHNMHALAVEELLMRVRPLVKMMHGYFGTCISGQKAHLFPSPVACARRYGLACGALYGPRRCGELSPAAFVRHASWAQRQRELFPRYSGVIVASAHMAAEYARNGVEPGKVLSNALFPTVARATRPAALPREFTVAFLGRMTRLKGGDVLVRAAAAAGRVLGAPPRLIFAGAGPARDEWEELARALGVSADFRGWVGEAALPALLREASVVAVPSVWPEPFGLVGLDAAGQGVAAVAFDTGGIRDWLEDGRTGRLVPPSRGATGLSAALVEAALHPDRLQQWRREAWEHAGRASVAAHVDRLLPMLERVQGSA
ncbi:MAG: hypothetical protein JWO05_1743 [Gemmatimonadetes bacterium]|nr:hypothetical protein [Gemmatimonadota bacterium]